MPSDEPTRLDSAQLLIQSTHALLAGVIDEHLAAFPTAQQNMYRLVTTGIVFADADDDEKATKKVRGLVMETTFLYPLFEQALALARHDREAGKSAEYLRQLLVCFGGVEDGRFVEELLQLSVEEAATRIVAEVLGREHTSSNNIKVARSKAVPLDPAQLHLIFETLFKAEEVRADAHANNSEIQPSRDAMNLVAIYTARTALGHFSEEEQNKIYDSLLHDRQRTCWATEIWEKEGLPGWEQITKILPALKDVDDLTIANAQARGKADDTLNRKVLDREELRTLLSTVTAPPSAQLHRKWIHESKADKFYRKPRS